MHDTRPALLPRVSATLRAKQYVVFFAIALYALDFAAPLLTSWLRRGGSLGDALDHGGSSFLDAGAAPGVAIAAVALTATAVNTFFRAGYIRSIVGRFHPGPRDFRQFARLFGLQLAIQALVVATVLAIDLTTSASGSLYVLLGGVASLLLVFVSFAIAYADYALVITGLAPWRAFARSWRVFRANPLPTMLVILAVTVLGALVSGTARAFMTGLPEALPAMLIEVIVFGLVLFVADVTLVIVYLQTIESGRVKERDRG